MQNETKKVTAETKKIIHENILRIWSAVNELRLASDTYIENNDTAENCEEDICMALREVGQACEVTADIIGEVLGIVPPAETEAPHSAILPTVPPPKPAASV